MSEKLELQGEVGTVRRVRNDLVVNKMYGGFRFVEGMIPLIGKEMTIAFVGRDRESVELQEEEEGNRVSFFWTEEMFEPLLTPTEQLVKYWAEEMQGMSDGDKFEVEGWDAGCPYSYKNGKILDKFDGLVSFDVYTSNFGLLLGNFKATILPEKVSLQAIIERANKALKEDSLTKGFWLCSGGVVSEVIRLRTPYISIPIWDSATDDEITTYEDFSEMMYGRIMELRSQLNQVYKLTEWRDLNGSIG